MPSVSEPATLAEAAEALGEARRSGRTVSIERPGGDVELRTARLDRVLEHEAGDLTATVEAGIRLSALNHALAEHGQTLPLDPPGDPTLGACIAANLSGPRRHRYGSPRDLVLGVTLVLADGTVASSGGKVVKNVAGYDLAKLMCGSEGRLALIARVSVRLHPLPRATATVSAPAVASHEAAARTSALLRSQLAPSAVDLHWPGALVALFEGRPGAVAAQAAAARELIGGEDAPADVWEESARRQREARGAVRFAPGSLADELRERREALVRPAAGLAYVPDVVADTMDGRVHALLQRVRRAFDPDGTLV